MRFVKALSLSLLFMLPLSLCAAMVAGDDGESDHRVKHVLLISVDGMHALDLANYVASHPDSTLAHLKAHGITYTNASSSQPSDSFPGLAALITGGSPITTGLWYDVSYNRKLSPPAKTTPNGIPGGANLCPGTVGTGLEFDEAADFDLTKLNGGGGINPDFLPRDPSNGCKPVFPHQYLRVNTILNVARNAGLYTEWTDKHPAYEWVNGPSNHGVNDFFGPEINSAVVPLNTPEFNVPRCHTVPDPPFLRAWCAAPCENYSFQSFQVGSTV